MDIFKDLKEQLVKDVINQREAIQEDIRSCLDGIDDDDLLDRVCQIVVDRMNILRDKLQNSTKGYKTQA